jgi:arylsulfatase A-like enzyme
MRAIILMYDSLNRHMLPPYGDTFVQTPNFERLAERTVMFDNFYAGSMPCMPARREMHTGRYNFLHRSWGPLEPFDDSVFEILKNAGIHTHLASDHPHYWEDGGATYHTRYSTWEFFRGQEGDPWKGVVDAPPDEIGGMFGRMRRQDAVNRSYMPTEMDHNQTQTVDAGIHFLETNAGADNWLLQLELFDPHEPFFVHEDYKKLYADDYEGPEFDWPPYSKVTEGADMAEHARNAYAALVTMCDHSLGRVLDFMDGHDMWDDTMLIVNTDHGYLLGEHGWWAKGVMPWYNELVHLPFFIWDPRTRGREAHSTVLAQTIDLAPTLLRYFGVEPTADMQGHDLAEALNDGVLPREAGLFGLHGAHVNVTDGRWVYMRAADNPENAPLEEFTLMPTHMRSRFRPSELAEWEPAEPFSFTKGVRTMRVPAGSPFINPWQHGTLLFDLENDPEQNHPVINDEVELRMLGLLVDLMRGNDAPQSQFERLGLPTTGAPTEAYLRVAADAGRAAETAEPVPPVETLAAAPILQMPLTVAIEDPVSGPILREYVGDLVSSEFLTFAPNTSVLDLVAGARLPVATLREIDARLARSGRR